MSQWILLRGLMREQRHWGHFPQQLAAALPDATIVTPDLPGNGSGHRLRSPTQVAHMVDACRRDLRARAIAPPYALLALSLGGMAAVDWASRYPQEVTHCVLINTSMRPYSRFHQRLRWQNYAAIMRQMLSGSVAQQEQLILRLTSSSYSTSGDAATRSTLLQRWLTYQRECPVSRTNALRQLWSAARFRAPSTRPAVPLLLLASAGDRLVDHGCSLRLAQAWQVPLLLHASAGHDLPLDDGTWVAAAVAEWLAAATTA